MITAKNRRGRTIPRIGSAYCAWMRKLVVVIRSADTGIVELVSEIMSVWNTTILSKIAQSPIVANSRKNTPRTKYAIIAADASSLSGCVGMVSLLARVLLVLRGDEVFGSDKPIIKHDLKDRVRDNGWGLCLQVLSVDNI